MLLGFIKSTKQLTTDHPPTLYKLKELQRRNQVKVLLKESLILETGAKHCYHVALVITLSLLLFNWKSILFTSYFLHSVIIIIFLVIFFHLRKLKIKLLNSPKFSCFKKRKNSFIFVEVCVFMSLKKSLKTKD